MHHGVAALLRFGLLGMLAGATLGAFAGALFVAAAPARFEANVSLFYKPGSEMSNSARDFIVAALAREDFLSDFVHEHRMDTKMEAFLTRNLTVVANDASGPFAEIRLVGSDAAAIVTTLDALATYMVELPWSAEENALQLQSQELDELIDAATGRYDKLVKEPLHYGRLPASTLRKIRIAANLAEQRFELELTERYRLQRQSTPDDLNRQQRLNAIVAQQEQLKLSVSENANTDSDHFEFESALALARAELRVLKRTRHRLVGELNRSKTLWALRRAKAIPVPTGFAPILILAASCSLIGGLGGGFAWSRRQSANGELSGPMIETRLRTPVVGVMAKSLTDYGERELHPMAQADPQPLAMAGVRSLSVALHVLSQEHDRAGPVIFADLGDAHHASHIVANLAVVAAEAGARVLIVEAGGESLLSIMFANDKVVARQLALDVSERAREQGGDSGVRFTIGDETAHNADAAALPVSNEIISHFDRVFIHVGDVAKARHVVKSYGAAIGIVVCTADTRLSVLRKALGKTLHGVVLCGFPIKESDYLGSTAGGWKMG